MAEEQQRSSSLRTIYVEFQIILSHRTVKPRTSPTCSRISLITVGHRCHTDARLTTSSRRHLCPLRLIAGLYSIRAQKKKPNAIFRSQRSDNKFKSSDMEGSGLKPAVTPVAGNGQSNILVMQT
ncbi:hypothetical protein F2Q69_00040783 [Brassica cretica]|uniref:Uncharacterized protein n=1 Tax=Brassica cretica TaxID=69181 RepID=A0A8S9ND04_BRACR|nr:hypothetical protein F2Q69_00040783 [Brassica cretica]